MRRTLLQSPAVLRRLALSLVLVVLVLGAAPARAGDPTQTWKTLESEHFVISYYEPNGDLARRVAVVAERAHRVLAPALRHVPDDKVIITLTDDTDGSNGWATVLPRRHIGLFATAPDALSVLSDHDDWLYGLVAHEYAHILHLDTMSGLPILYNAIFGRRWAPNNVQPRWFIEGLATYEESKRSSGGRTRNALFEMYLRVPLLAGKAIELDGMSAGPAYWPYGHTHYLYGGFFLKFIADRYGDDKIAAISHQYGAQPIPWGLSRAVKRSVGKDYLELYDEWMTALRARYELQRDAVERRGRVEGLKLTDTGESNLAPRFTAGGDVIWLQHDGRREGGYRRLSGARAAAPLVFDGGGRHALLPDGSGLVVERSITYRTQYAFTDLYRVDWDGRATRLTHGARASSPDVSRDGRWLAFSQNGGARQALAIMENQPGAERRVVWEGGRFDQAFDPAWSPDGETLAFSAWTEGGWVDLYLWERRSGAVRRLTEDRARDITPRFTPDGRHLVFSSDRSGIYNLYRLALDDGALAQLTNVLGGAFSPDLSPDGKSVVYSGFDGDGYELYRLALDDARALVPEPFVDDRPDPVRILDREIPPTPPRDYRPILSLAPVTYEIRSTVDSFGSAVSVATSGNDVANHHSWYLAATYGFERGDVGFGAAYAYNRLWPGLSLSVGRGTGLAGGLVIDGQNTAFHYESWGGSASVRLPVVREPEVYSDLSFSYDASWFRNVDPPIMHDPNDAVPVLPLTGVSAGVGASWFLSDVRGFARSLGPVAGRGLSLGLRLDHPSLGASARGIQVYYRWDQYQGLPWWGHALALRTQGGIGESDRPGGVRFWLGGVPRQDLIQAIIDSTRAGNVWFHGYPEGSISGSQYHVANLEYRVPLVELEKGIATLPFYFRRVHLAALFDAGNAFDGNFDPAALRYAVGASLRVDMLFGFFVPGSFDLGWARGLSTGGVDEFWLLLTGGL
jgi:hypothetical protein